MKAIESPLVSAARQSASLVAMRSGAQEISYGDLYRTVEHAVASLRAGGVHEESRAAIVSDNALEYIIALLAIWHLRAVACPINPKLPEDTINEYLSRVGCSHILLGPGHNFSSSPLPQIELTSLTSESRAESLHDLDPASEAVVIATSGSTSAPKAVLLTMGNLHYNALGSNSNIILKEGDSWLLSLPLYHVGGLGIVLRCLLAQSTIILPQQKTSIQDSVCSQHPTHLSLVHTQLYRLMKDYGARESLVAAKAILLGGSAFPSSLIRAAHDVGLNIHTSYGLSEMASQVCTTEPNAVLEQLSTSGKVLLYRELAVSSDGEILVCGETRFKGYSTSAGLEQPFDDAGWFATGDLGSLDAKGNLAVLGRRDNRFISGGENIYPEEIEAAFYRVPSVEEVVVVPVEDPEFGKRSVAFVKSTDENDSQERFEASMLEDFLPRFKIPVACYPWPADLTEAKLKPSRQYFTDLARRLRS